MPETFYLDSGFFRFRQKWWQFWNPKIEYVKIEGEIPTSPPMIIVDRYIEIWEVPNDHH